MVERMDNEKLSYLQGLRQLFKDFIELKKADPENLQTLTDAMFDWYYSLPQITLTFQEMDGMVEKDRRLMKELRRIIWKKSSDPEKVLFQKLLHSMEAGKDLAFCLRQITRVKRQMELHVRWIKQEAAERVRRIFKDRSHEDLEQCLKSWLLMLYYREDTVFSASAQMFLQFVENLYIHNEEEIISRISKIVMGCYVEDWKNGSLNEFTIRVREVKEEIETKQEICSKEKEIIFTGNNGRWIRWCFSIPEDTKQNHNFLNSVKNVIQTQGKEIQVKEQAAILIGEVEQMLEKIRCQNPKKEQSEE